MEFSFLHSVSIISTLGSTRDGFVSINTCLSVSASIHFLDNLFVSGTLGIEHFQSSVAVSDELCIFSYIHSNSCVHFSGEI